MKKIILPLMMFLTAFGVYAQSVFINEIHYDNQIPSGDLEEGVEIAGPAGTDLGIYRITLYNLTGGASYFVLPLTGIIPDEGCGFGAVWFPISGIQNGGSDGIALYDTSAGTVVQFLSYEGVLTATNGDASGMTSTDIGVAETSGVDSSMSLQLNGTGNLYVDFTWTAAATSTHNSSNTTQDFCVADTNVKVYFDVFAANLMESSGTVSVQLNLSAAAVAGDSVIIGFTSPSGAVYGSDFTTAPDGSGGQITVPFAVDSMWAAFDLTIIDDADWEGEDTIMFTIIGFTGNIDSTILGGFDVTIAPSDAPLGQGPAVFVNEIHYDDFGTDTLEGIEIAGPAGTDLGIYRITLYNQTGGASYLTLNLSGIIPDMGCGYGTIWFPIANIQNGAADGICLFDTAGNSLVQFISYEGVLTATDGDAIGVASEDIGVSEPGAELLSLQLGGTGTNYLDFTWQTIDTNTYDAINNNQSFCVAAAIPTVNFGLVSDIAYEGGDSVLFSLILSDPAVATDTVWFEVDWSGTMTDADWVEVMPDLDTFFVVFQPGDTAYTTYLHAFDDLLTEGWEYGFIRMISSTDSIIIGTMDTLNVSIADNDVPPAINVASASATMSVNETDGTATINFDVFPAPAVAGTIQVLVTNGTGAVYGTDYSTTPAPVTDTITVTVPMGVTTFSFSFDIINDTDIESNETVTFDIVGFSVGLDTVSGMTSSVVTMISEDMLPTISMSSAAMTVNESAGTASVTMNIAPVAASAGTVQVLVANGTGAVYGTDYTTTPAPSTDTITVTVPMGVSTFSFSFDIIDDAAVESSENVTFSIVGISAGLDTTSGSVTTVVTMTDNDGISWTPIYDIQYTTNPSGTSPDSGNMVTTRGVVSAVQPTGRFYIQDASAPWHGIYIYEGGTAVSRGDSVEVTGTVTEYFGYTEFKAGATTTIISSGNTVHAPIVLNTNQVGDEQYESVLVQVVNATCNNPNVGFGMWAVYNGTTADSVLIDDQMYAYSPLQDSTYDVTGVVDYSYSEYKILPRDSMDIVGPEFLPAMISIYDIQYSPVTGASPEEGNIVRTTGIVTGIIQFGADSGRFFIQDGTGPWNGIYVYKKFANVAVGDSVLVTGLVKEFFSLTEIANVEDVTVVDTGHALPAPYDVSTTDASKKDYEGVLIQTDAICKVAMNGFFEWEINDLSSFNNLVVGSDIWTYNTPVANSQYVVTGIMHYSFNPILYSTDVRDTTGVGIEESILANSVSLYPNPSNTRLNIAFTSQTNDPVVIVIKDVLGREMYAEDVNAFGKVTRNVDVSTFDAGVYTVQFMANGQLVTKKFSVLH